MRTIYLMFFWLLCFVSTGVAVEIGKLQTIIICNNDSGDTIVQVSEASLSTPTYYEAQVTAVAQPFRGLVNSRQGNFDVYSNNPAFADRLGGGEFRLSIDLSTISHTKKLPSTLEFFGQETQTLICVYQNIEF